MRWPLIVILVSTLVFFLLTMAVNLPTWEDSPSRVFLPDGTAVAVEVADSAEERRVGLSEHVSLAPDRGMLFLFDEPGAYAFWMKDMDFSIDIIWLNGETIVGIEPNVPVPTPGVGTGDLPIYEPEFPTDRVLEVNAGLAAAHGLAPGDFLDIQLP